MQSSSLIQTSTAPEMSERSASSASSLIMVNADEGRNKGLPQAPIFFIMGEKLHVSQQLCFHRHSCGNNYVCGNIEVAQLSNDNNNTNMIVSNNMACLIRTRILFHFILVFSMRKGSVKVHF